MRFVNYGSCLMLGANAEGLFVSVLFFFRVGHPPLFIPWSEVESATHYRSLLFPMVKFKFKKAPSVSFKMSRKLALAVTKQARDRFSLPAS